MSILLEKLPRERLETMLAEMPWYHTFEFPGGLKTKGTYDNAPTLPHYHFPASLGGKTAIDIGTADGFFAFELERRGASVLAIDPNQFDGALPTDVAGAKTQQYAEAYANMAAYSHKYQDVMELLNMRSLNHFLIARDLFDSQANYQNGSIYDLHQWGKKFDVVMCGDLIEHLKNPLWGLENLVTVTGELCVIALSGALVNQQHNRRRDRLVRKLAKWLEVPIETENLATKVEYLGAGRGFFRFHPLAFKKALFAAGFKEVETKGEFDLLNNKWQIYNHHVIFHCYV